MHTVYQRYLNFAKQNGSARGAASEMRKDGLAFW